MSGVSKISAERNQKVLLDLLTKPGNNVCADCKARNPRWGSHNLGIFICVSCASIHRKMGTHISKVKSVTLDSWTKEQVESMKAMGNLKSNAIHNPNETRYPPPPALADPENDAELESYIRSKYQYKKFIDKVALVTLKLGPTRSASRSASTPVINRKAPTPPPIHNSPFVPSVTNTPVQTSPPRPSTIAPSSARSASQPRPPPQQQKDGVWADLISLNDPPGTSSLPLQYQMGPTPTGVGFSVNAPGNAFTHSLQMTNPMVATSYHARSFPPPLPTAGFAPSNVFISSSPLSMVQTGFVTSQAQQQFLQPRPMSTGLPLTVSQPLVQHPQFTTPSPVIFSTPSPAIGPNLSSTTPQLPGYTQTQTTVTMSQPGVMMAGAPQMQMAMPIQPGMTTGYMPSMQTQSHVGYTTGMYRAPTGFGNMGQQQWGPL
ncbi:hypothetical protein APHAL10511_007292 [Amanita phalloides]|nr:hypothetical protein APHAL10511_007292 [Amanita phalloides]